MLVPEVEGAAAVLGGEGVAGGAEVEERATVFEEGSGRVLGQKRFERGGDLLGGLRGGVWDGAGSHSGIIRPGNMEWGSAERLEKGLVVVAGDWHTLCLGQHGIEEFGGVDGDDTVVKGKNDVSFEPLG